MLTFSTVCFVVVSASLSWQLDQCPDLPAPIKFYKGSPEEDGLKEITLVFEQLFGSLGELFKSIGKNNRTDFGFPGNWTEMFNNLNYTFPATSNETSEIVTEAPVVVSTKPPGAPPSMSFDLGHFLKNILPPQASSNSTAGQIGQPHIGFKVGPAASSPPNFGHFLGGFKPPTPNAASSDANGGAVSASAANESWGIVVPANTVRLQIAKINQSVIVDAFQLDAQQLRDPRHMLNEKKFVRGVDLKDFDVQPGLLYIVCVNLALSQDGQSRQCQRCVLAKPCDGGDCHTNEKILEFQATASRVRPYDARLHFFIHDLPLANVSLVTRIQPHQPDSRCPEPSIYSKPPPQARSAAHRGDPDQSSPPPQRLEQFDKFERLDRLFPYSILYMDVPNLSPKQAYSVEGDLSIEIGDQASALKDFDWSSPLVVKDYFGAQPEKEYVIGACSRSF